MIGIAHPRSVAFAGLVALLLPARATGADTDPARGKLVYETHCLECHGESGGGDGDKAERLGFRPRDLRRGSFKCRCTASGEPPTDADLLRTVTDGLPGTVMRGFATKLPEADLSAVVAYIKTLSPVFAEAAPACLEIPDPVASSEEAIDEGRQLYRLLRCWNCHGVEGKGDGPAAKGLVDAWGAKIRVYNFTRPKRFKCGGEDRDLYRTLHTGLAGTPMPSFSTSLAFASDQVGDLGALEESLGNDTIDETGRWLGGQPDAAALEALGQRGRWQLGERRTWALVHYLQSLVER